ASHKRSAESDISIPDQLRQMRDYFKKRGDQIVGEYVDAGISGREDHNRPDFQRMMDDAFSRRGGFDAIGVYSSSRLFRNLFKSEWYRLRLAKIGVEVISITQQFGEGPEAQLIRQVFGAFDEYSSNETSKHVLRTMIANAEAGFVNGRPRFGYRAVVVEKRGDKLKKKFEPDDEEAEIVRLMFQLSKGGLTGADPMGVKEISKELARRHKVKRNGKNFSSTEVHEILQNTMYVGRYIWNKRDMRRGQNKPPDQWKIVSVPSIVDEELFEAVQRSLHSRDPLKVSTRTSAHPTLLSGLARCSSCGGAMGLMSGNGNGGNYRYYKCRNWMVNRNNGCKDPRVIREDLLDTLVVDHLADIVLEPQRVRALISEAIEAEKAEQDELPRQLDRLIRRKSNIDSSISRMHQAIERGLVDFDDASFTDRLRSLKDERTEIDEQIGVLRNAANSFPPLTAERVREFSTSLRSALRVGESRARRAYLRFFVERVVVHQHEVKLVGHKGLLARAYANDWQTAAMGKNNLRRNPVPPQVSNWWSQPGSNR
ncbi:MAG TPA: recombinase family protein, partial [Stellaceae bacterium]|nr:recombinase family protein [Stellaceae bacterium]